MTDAAPLSNRLGKRLGSQSTRTGLPSPAERAKADVKTTRGTDELLARAREAEEESSSVDHSTLSTIHDRLRNV